MRRALSLTHRVIHLCLVSPAGFPTRKSGERPTRSYREAGPRATRSATADQSVSIGSERSFAHSPMDPS